MNFFFCRFFFKLLLNCSDFINYDDCFGKITSKSIRVKSCFINIFFNITKKGIISSEKMRNSGNYNYCYAYSFFGKNF